MRMIRTPDNIFSDGALYLRIYVGGLIFLFLYNVATGIFTALGDSKTPLYFLIGSSLGNIALDTWFVAGFHWGVAGVAWATFIAQGIACILALLTLVRRLRQVGTKEAFALFSWSMLKKISLIAVPSILQQSFVSVGNIFIQSLVNSFGSSVIAGYSAAIKLNTFFIAFFIFGQNMIQLFMSGDASAVAMNTGISFLKIVAPFYFVISVKLVIDGMLRGAGAMVSFMAATFADLILRVILSYILASYFEVTGIWMSWPIGWSIATLMSVLFYLRGKWAEKFKMQ